MLELFRQYGICCFSVRLLNCSDSVFLFVFLLDCWTVLTVFFCLFFYWIAELFWVFFCLFFYWITELFWQCFFVCFSIGLQNCSDSGILFVFLLDYWTVLTVWYFLFFYWIAELFWQWYFFQLFILFTTIVVSLNPAHGEVYWTQHYLIKFVKWLATGLWLSPVSSTSKNNCHNITEILLKVALNTRTLTLT